MSTLQIKNGRISVPDEIRRELGLHDGDQMEAHVVAGGMFLRRTAKSPEEIEQAWNGLFEIIRRPKGNVPQPATSTCWAPSLRSS